MTIDSVITSTTDEFNKYSKYITFATIIAATFVAGVVIYGLVTKKA